MNNSITCGLIAIVSCLGWWLPVAQAAEQYDLGAVVISATKIEQAPQRVSSSTTILSGEQLRDRGIVSVFDALRTVPGLQLAQAGPNGGVTYVYIRGAKPEHTLVLIDGVEVNDPFSINRSFDFAHLTTANIERIEIIRGNQTALYGADAIGGVIQIITKKGAGAASGSAELEAGSHRWWRGQAGISGGSETHHFSATVEQIRTDGISQARGGREDDGYTNITVSGRAGVVVRDSAEASVALRYTRADADIDDGAYDDDPNFTALSEQFSSRLQWQQSLHERWQHVLSLSGMTINRRYRDLPDSNDPGDDYDDRYAADHKKIEWQHDVSLFERDITTAGVEYEVERGSNELRGAWASRFDRRRTITKGAYLQQQWEVTPAWTTLLGARFDDHSRFGEQTTYRGGTSYTIDTTATRLTANAATGFKAPTLYQLFSFYGDPDLQPETSRNYDIGIEQELLTNTLFGKVTGFYNSFNKMIDFDMSSFTYGNIARAKTRGVESEARLRLSEHTQLSGAYTILDTENKDTRQKLARRPKNSASLSYDWRPASGAALTATARYSGTRFSDPDNTVKLKHYTVLDISGSYPLNETLTAFGRVDNVFNKDYQEVDGYTVLGQALYAGIRGQW